MDTRDNNIAWWIAGVLLVLLIIVGYFWISNRQSLQGVLSNGQQALAAERDQIQKDCSRSSPNTAACNRDLDDLRVLLEEFSKNINNASTSTTTP
jgi:F0F1-type ATP synthase membrane subunit b/b'